VPAQGIAQLGDVVEGQDTELTTHGRFFQRRILNFKTQKATTL
jgi:hypothetical protein